MPGASYSKPDATKRNRVPPVVAWKALAAEHSVVAPALPKWRDWDTATRAWWKNLWKNPQATEWRADGSTLWTLACLYDELISGGADVAKVSAEMRQHEDRHGLNPKSMQQLHWKVAEPEVAEHPKTRTTRTRLRAVK